MRHKLNLDLDIESSLEKRKKTIDKRNTKGMFASSHLNNSGHWMVDRNWHKRANLELQKVEK